MKIQMLVNQTGVDTRKFDSLFWESAKTGTALPEAIADLFSISVREVSDENGNKVVRAFVTMA